MKSRLNVTRLAEEDLLSIWDYVSDDNVTAANELLTSIESKFVVIQSQPNAGVLRSDLVPGIRSVPIGNYLIFYRAEAITVTVLRVLHGAQDLRAIFRRQLGSD